MSPLFKGLPQSLSRPHCEWPTIVLMCAPGLSSSFLWLSVQSAPVRSTLSPRFTSTLQQRWGRGTERPLHHYYSFPNPIYPHPHHSPYPACPVFLFQPIKKKCLRKGKFLPFFVCPPFPTSGKVSLHFLVHVIWFQEFSHSMRHFWNWLLSKLRVSTCHEGWPNSQWKICVFIKKKKIL